MSSNPGKARALLISKFNEVLQVLSKGNPHMRDLFMVPKLSKLVKPIILIFWSKPRLSISIVIASLLLSFIGMSFAQSEKPLVEQQVTLERPLVEQQTLEKPLVEEQTLEKPLVEQQTLEKPLVEQQTLEKPTLERPTLEKPLVEQQTLEKPLVEQQTLENWLNNKP